MNAADLAKPENALIEVCKDLLMIDLVGIVQEMDLAGPSAPAVYVKMSPERFQALHKVAVALLAARGMAEGLRDVIVAETRRELGVWTATPTGKGTIL